MDHVKWYIYDSFYIYDSSLESVKGHFEIQDRLLV